MSRRPSLVTQADIARAIRAAKQEGAREVEVRVADKAAIVIKLGASSTEDCNPALAPRTEIIL
jgi:hypothetical protein